MNTFKMTLPFEPVPTARARAGKYGFYDKQAPLKRILGLLIKAEVHKHKGWKPYSGPLAAGFLFSIPRPKAHYRAGKCSHQIRDAAMFSYPTKADFDNYTKFICDAMNGVVYRDDRQIIKAVVLKQFARVGSIEVVIGPWVVKPMTLDELTANLF